MLSSGGGGRESNCNCRHNLFTSSSSSSPIQSPSPPSQQFCAISPLQLPIGGGGKSMEEVWEDLNLASLHRAHQIPNFRPTPFQDFLSRPFPADRRHHSPTASAANAALFGSPPPPTLLTLNPALGFQSFDNPAAPHSAGVRTSPAHPNRYQINNTSEVSPVDVFGASGFMLPFGGRARFSESPEGGFRSGGDRRKTRMIKNRESAARSRARKQAYTHELEREIAHLMQENARLRRQQQQLCVAAAASNLPKKQTLLRSSTAPF